MHTAKRRVPTVLLAGICAVLLAGVLSGQEGETDVSEFSAQTGMAFGPGTHFTAGGSAGISLDRYLVGLIDCSYIHFGNDVLLPRYTAPARASQLYDFSFSLDIRVPNRSKWEPYAILGVAVLYNHFQAPALQPDGSIVYVPNQKQWRGAFETGAGVRYYVERNWGVRGEFRYTASTQNFSRLLIGVFRQF